MTVKEIEKQEAKEFEAFNKLYWKHYEILENKFMQTLYYVEFDKNNFKTFSVEYEQLLMSIGSEVDIAFQKLCYLVCGSKVEKYNDYVKTLTSKGINLGKVKFLCKEDCNFYKPWFDWKKEGIVSDAGNRKGTFWWRNYQTVKHFRADNDVKGVPNHTKANLKTVFYALMGLYTLNKGIIEKLDQYYKKLYADNGADGNYCPSFEYKSNLFE